MTKHNISRNFWAKIGTICLFAAAISSCTKSNPAYTNPPTALVTFVQASPDEPALDFYLNNNKVNPVAVNYQNFFSYFQAYAGQTTAYFYNTGTMTKIFSDSVTFKANNAYSLFLANKVSSPELVLLTDTINPPASGMSSIRFINLSPGSSAVDLAVHGGAVLVPNKSYKGYTGFLPITGNTSYTFEVRQAGTSTVLATMPSLKITSGGVYTIYLDGLPTPTNGTDGLSLNFLTNAYYPN